MSTKRPETTSATVEPCLLARTLASGETTLVDVRGFDEIAAGRIESAICIPLPDLERRAGEIATNGSVCLVCESGGRADMAAERLRALGFTNVTCLHGGMRAWRAAGLPCLSQRGVIPLERQVRGIAGAIVLTSVVFGLIRWRPALFITGFVGLMLAFSGVTGLCPMLTFLRRMPWNRFLTTTAVGSTSQATLPAGG